MKIHAGTSGYGYRQWEGGFYPRRVSPGEMLRFYSKHFGTVEVNNTFYRMPTEGVLASWADQVPGDFIFAFKAPRVITHLKRLKDVVQETGHLFGTLSVLGARLGPVLFQFPESFDADPGVLKAFLALVPRTISCAFEFRSESRHDTGILDLLRENECSLCISDSEDDREVRIIRTAPWGYLRLRRSAYGEAELERWLQEIRSQDWTRAFVFFKHDEAADGPGSAMRFNGLVSV